MHLYANFHSFLTLRIIFVLNDPTVGPIQILCHSCITVDGKWSPWQQGVCSVSCGEGEMVLTRQCNNPSPKFGGKPCQGNSKETVPCNLKQCPGEFG